MLGCIQPMSSPMTNTMLGFDVACAIALVAGSADAVASAASAAPAVRVVRHKLIAISNLACRPTRRLLRKPARGAPHASSDARVPLRPAANARDRRLSPDKAARYAESGKWGN